MNPLIKGLFIVADRRRSTELDPVARLSLRQGCEANVAVVGSTDNCDVKRIPCAARSFT